jgi:hypothetical protein
MVYVSEISEDKQTYSRCMYHCSVLLVCENILCYKILVLSQLNGTTKQAKVKIIIINY